MYVNFKFTLRVSLSWSLNVLLVSNGKLFTSLHVLVDFAPPQPIISVRKCVFTREDSGE